MAGWVACAPKGGQTAPIAVVREIERQMSLVSAIPWSADRRLTWEDFRGVPPAAPGDEGARTAYSLFHGARCAGTRFEFDVIAAVLPRESWVTPTVLQNPALSLRSLRHEQTHFDLTEVHARRMRRFFRELVKPCGRSEIELHALADRFTREEALAQQRYDDETNYGRMAERQADWNAEAARQIASLRAFER
jgi:hypothetical protein